MNKHETRWFLISVEAETTIINAENLKILKSKKT
ncbi:MAG: hypothetical protein RLZZ71_1378 [Bacteroidota bacterium]|jgi:hypothetical protein